MTSFLERFKGKTSVMTKEGVSGIIRDSDNPIKKAAMNNLQPLGMSPTLSYQNYNNNNDELSQQFAKNRVRKEAQTFDQNQPFLSGDKKDYELSATYQFSNNTTGKNTNSSDFQQFQTERIINYQDLKPREYMIDKTRNNGINQRSPYMPIGMGVGQTPILRQSANQILQNQIQQNNDLLQYTQTLDQQNNTYSNNNNYNGNVNFWTNPASINYSKDANAPRNQVKNIKYNKIPSYSPNQYYRQISPNSNVQQNLHMDPLLKQQMVSLNQQNYNPSIQQQQQQQFEDMYHQPRQVASNPVPVESQTPLHPHEKQQKISSSQRTHSAKMKQDQYSNGLPSGQEVQMLNKYDQKDILDIKNKQSYFQRNQGPNLGNNEAMKVKRDKMDRMSEYSQQTSQQQNVQQQNTQPSYLQQYSSKTNSSRQQSKKTSDQLLKEKNTFSNSQTPGQRGIPRPLPKTQQVYKQELQYQPYIQQNQINIKREDINYSFDQEMNQLEKQHLDYLNKVEQQNK